MDEIIETFVGVAIFVTIFVAGLSLEYYCEKRTCIEQANAIGYKYSFGFWQGCIVEKDGKKMLLEQIRNME